MTRSYNNYNYVRTLLIVLGTLFFISSCSFEIMYKENNASSKIEYLPPIDVTFGKISVKDKRIYQIFVDKINEQFISEKENSKYNLLIDLSQSVSGASTTSTGSVGRYKYDLIVNYTIVLIKTGKKIDSGTIKSISSYESSNSRFTTYSSEQDTLDKLLDSLVQKLKIKVVTTIKNSI
jgi:hypothetical protein